ncbi:MAG: hypothetical protein NC251_10460 [Lachnoclostridium sp.]|nr:hypothetical protein [Lachnospira sp.]MCM1248840.1 hypothetical protein [Lachnoclostridium sp.]MCM1535307.1 hypothetical protein [Clostridium sp.]
MFLYLLKEDNKVRFIELCKHASEADEIVDAKEIETINVYCREMGISEEAISDKRELDMILEELKNGADVTEKKIILFEILGLMLADEQYTESEEQFVLKIIETFGIDNQSVNNMYSLLEIYKAVYKQLYMAVCL